MHLGLLLLLRDLDEVDLGLGLLGRGLGVLHWRLGLLGRGLDILHRRLYLLHGRLDVLHRGWGAVDIGQCYKIPAPGFSGHVAKPCQPVQFGVIGILAGGWGRGIFPLDGDVYWGRGWGSFRLGLGFRHYEMGLQGDVQGLRLGGRAVLAVSRLRCCRGRLGGRRRGLRLGAAARTGVGAGSRGAAVGRGRGAVAAV